MGSKIVTAMLFIGAAPVIAVGYVLAYVSIVFLHYAQNVPNIPSSNVPEILAAILGLALFALGSVTIMMYRHLTRQIDAERKERTDILKSLNENIVGLKSVIEDLTREMDYRRRRDDERGESDRR